MKPLPLRTSLTILYTSMLAVLVAGLAVASHWALARQLDRDATVNLEAKARGLHGYLTFAGGTPTLSYHPDDLEAAAFIDDATDYYQVFDAGNGRMLTQSPGLASLGLPSTAPDVGAAGGQPGVRDVPTRRGRLRLVGTLVTPAPGSAYLVEVGELMDDVDRSLARFDRLLVWQLVAGLAVAAVLGRWLAARALAPLTRVAQATRGISVAALDRRLPVRGTQDELDQVTAAFNEALGRIEQSVREMRQFSGALAHELRTPLAILRGEAELALRSAATDDERRATLARQIDECDRLSRLINQILTLARAEAGEIALAREPVDIAALSATVAEQMEPVALARGVTMTCRPAERVTVVGDAGWLERLLLILLDNAITFTPEGGRVAVTVASTGGRPSLAVTDTGVGIRSDDLPHVFERFYRGEPAASHETPGAGLGLALARWIADRHGAGIAVSSHPGAGSTFTVTFPASRTVCD